MAKKTPGRYAKAIILCGAVCLSSQAFAVGLLDLYREAQQSDAQFAAAKADREAADFQITQARGQLLPQVGINASRMRNDQTVSTTYPIESLNSTREYGFMATNGSLNLSQALFRPQLWAAYAQAKAQVRQAEGNFLQAKQDLIVRVAQAYFDILLAEDNVSLAAEQKAAIAEQLKQAQRYFEAGVGTVTDINEAQARFDTVVAQGIAADSNLEIKIRVMEQLVGKLYRGFGRLGASMPLDQPEPSSVERWLEFALATNPLIKAREAALEVAQNEVYKSAAAHLPNVDIVAGRYFSKNPGYTTINTESWNNTVGVQVYIPLFTGGATQGRLNQSSALRERAQAEFEGALRSTTLNIRQEYLNVVNGVAQVKALEQAVKSNELALYSARKGLEAGVRTSFDVLNAQQLLFSAKRDLAQERYRYVLSRFRLRSAAGLLDEEDVELVQRHLALQQ